MDSAVYTVIFAEIRIHCIQVTEYHTHNVWKILLLSLEYTTLPTELTINTMIKQAFVLGYMLTPASNLVDKMLEQVIQITN